MKIIVRIAIYILLLWSWILRQVNHYEIRRSWFDCYTHRITYSDRVEIVRQRLLVIDDLTMISDELYAELDKL